MLTEIHDTAKKPSEVFSTQVYEMQSSDNSKHELSSERMPELQATSLERELEGEGLPVGAMKKKWDVYELE